MHHSASHKMALFSATICECMPSSGELAVYVSLLGKPVCLLRGTCQKRSMTQLLILFALLTCHGLWATRPCSPLGSISSQLSGSLNF